MKLSWTDAWRDAVALFRANAELVIAVAGVFLFLPAMAAGFLVPEPQLTATDPWQRLGQLVAHVQRFQWISFLLNIPASFGQAAILVLLLDTSRPTVAEALRRALSLFLGFFLLNILVNLSIALGIVLLFVPGLYLIGRLITASPALVSERLLNPIAAYARGWRVSRGNGWRIFGMVAIVALTAWIVQGATTAIIGSVLALAAGAEAARVIGILLGGVFGAALSILLLLIAAAIYRQLADDAPSPVSLNKGI